MNTYIPTIQIKNKINQIYFRSSKYFPTISVSFPKRQHYFTFFVGIILLVKQIVCGTRDGKW